MRERLLSSTTHPMTFLMVLSSDHVTAATGLSPTVTISKDGAAFGSPAGAVVELANGWYTLAGNATDRNALGGFILHASAATADPVDIQYTIVGYDPFDAVRMGMTALPNVASGSTGAIPTTGTGANQIAVDGAGNAKVDVNKWLAGAIPAVNVTGVPKVDIADVNGVTVNGVGTAGNPWGP